MNESRLKKISKLLSYVLRHNPKKIGIEIKDNGWVDISELIEKSKDILEFNFDELKYVVDNNDKKRFSLNEDETLIKANQGHSTKVNIEFKEVVPPQILYHGAPTGVIDAIMKGPQKNESPSLSLVKRY